MSVLNGIISKKRFKKRSNKITKKLEKNNDISKKIIIRIFFFNDSIPHARWRAPVEGAGGGRFYFTVYML